ncbi:MAG: hypothetical protein AB7I52_12790 [Rhizobiaceae bacterium]
MLFELGTFWLVMAVAAECVFGYMFGTALDTLTGEDGFGALGNMFVLVGGFFGSIVVANRSAKIWTRRCSPASSDWAARSAPSPTSPSSRPASRAFDRRLPRIRLRFSLRLT